MRFVKASIRASLTLLGNYLNWREFPLVPCDITKTRDSWRLLATKMDIEDIALAMTKKLATNLYPMRSCGLPLSVIKENLWWL